MHMYIYGGQNKPADARARATEAVDGANSQLARDSKASGAEKGHDDKSASAGRSDAKAAAEWV
jgi:hypothetical protein